MIDLLAADELLRTTRSVRKRLDLTRDVPFDLVLECIDLALQAPTGSNRQGWSFIVVSDRDQRAELARLYKQAVDLYMQMPRPEYGSDDPRAASGERVATSARYLADHLHEVPVHLVPCIEGRVEEAGVLAQASTYGSILPAVWSFALAARARGLGTAWTTLHLMFEREAAEVLGIPDHITQAALLPVAYFTGETFKPAPRLPAATVTHLDRWGTHPA
ncbi:MAG: nitroreductase family protein [Actinomycetes bacterium]